MLYRALYEPVPVVAFAELGREYRAELSRNVWVLCILGGGTADRIVRKACRSVQAEVDGALSMYFKP